MKEGRIEVLSYLLSLLQVLLYILVIGAAAAAVLNSKDVSSTIPKYGTRKIFLKQNQPRPKEIQKKPD